jgi:hypothetical protein
VVDGIKDYTLIVLEVPFSHFISSSLIINTFYVMKNVLIGYQLKQIGELLTQQKQWGAIDFPEKCFFVAILCLITFSFSATAFFTYWAQRQMNGKASNTQQGITKRNRRNEKHHFQRNRNRDNINIKQ